MRSRQIKKNRRKRWKAEFPPLVGGANRPVTWNFGLESIEETGAITNGVEILLKPGRLSVDESGENGYERFASVTLTRAEIAMMLKVLEEDIGEMRRCCPGDVFL
jgi:hypothetical protein